MIELYILKLSEVCESISEDRGDSLVSFSLGQTGPVGLEGVGDCRGGVDSVAAGVRLAVRVQAGQDSVQLRLEALLAGVHADVEAGVGAALIGQEVLYIGEEGGESIL